MRLDGPGIRFSDEWFDTRVTRLFYGFEGFRPSTGVCLVNLYVNTEGLFDWTIMILVVKKLNLYVAMWEGFNFLNYSKLACSVM